VSSAIVAIFVPSTNGSLSAELSHVVADPTTWKMYAAAKNRLWQLDGNDLTIEAQVNTGPRMDSPTCHASGCDTALDRSGSSSSANLLPTDNYNKILLINHEARELIVCGSVHQGACELYKLGNVSVPPVFIPTRYLLYAQTRKSHLFTRESIYLFAVRTIVYNRLCVSIPNS
jgi:plexin A